MKDIVNLTPHDIIFIKEQGRTASTKTFPKSGDVARATEKNVKSEPINGMSTVLKEYGEIENLPDQTVGKFYIVSLVVFERSTRSDLIVPDTGPGSAVRDSDGKIIGVKRFIRRLHRCAQCGRHEDEMHIDQNKNTICGYCATNYGL